MNTKKTFDKALLNAKKKLDPQVRHILTTSGWPEEITIQLRLETAKGKIGLYIPEELREKVDELEYGTIKTSPTYVLRKIDELVDEVTSNEVADVLEEYIFSEVI